MKWAFGFQHSGTSMISKQLREAEKFKTVDGNGVVMWRWKIVIVMEQKYIKGSKDKLHFRKKIWNEILHRWL